LEHFKKELALFAWGFTGGVDHGSPVSKGVQRSFEADACERFVISDGGGLHEIADDIVGDRVHEEFAGDHVGRAAAKDVHKRGQEFIIDILNHAWSGPACLWAQRCALVGTLTLLAHFADLADIQ
jgi:hypothetical protein